jgi:hypothetical protein
LGEKEKLSRKDIPKYLETQVQPIENEAWIELRIGHYKEAFELYKQEYGLYLQAEKRENRSLHKGNPLHLAGVCLFWMGDFENSVNLFLLAYCEDVLSEPLGKEDSADRSPACSVLRDTYVIDLSFLTVLKKYARKAKTANVPIQKSQETLLSQGLKEIGTNETNILTDLCQATKEQLERRSLDPIIADWPSRVFIGGAFRELPRLRDIQEAVIRLNYNPILTHEVQGAEQSVHHHNLMLLHTCKYAIFEVTLLEGQLMEIERTTDYGIIPLLVCAASEESDDSRVKLSAMLETAGFKIRGYRDIAHLRTIISEYLTAKKQA